MPFIKLLNHYTGGMRRGRTYQFSPEIAEDLILRGIGMAVTQPIAKAPETPAVSDEQLQLEFDTDSEETND